MSVGRLVAACVRPVLALALVLSCSDTVVYPSLYLAVSAGADSERPDSLDVTVGTLVRDAGGVERFVPAVRQSADRVIQLGGTDIRVTPHVVRLEPASDAQVTLLVRGLADGDVVGFWSGTVEPASKTQVSIVLTAVPGACDADGDGFPNCSLPDCCPADQAAVGDCDDAPGDSAGSLANPLAAVPECVPCAADGSSRDFNCDGTLDACVDDDGDHVANCAEAACGSQGDNTIYPGATESCDGKDNDCNGATDENSKDTDGDELADCVDDDDDGDGNADLSDCQPLNKAVYVGATETCNEIDDDCDSETDEGVADCKAWGGDWDGDGFLASEGQDCNEYDSKIYKGSTYVGCCDPALQGSLTGPALLAACDFDCDGVTSLCDPEDADFDTFKDGSAKDCPAAGTEGRHVFKGAPELCGDGIDQDCSFGDVACSAGEDADGDGYFADVDCNDGDEDIHPWQPELCDGVDQDCNGFVDDGNPGGGAACVNPDRQTGECLLEEYQGVRVCAHGLQASTAPASPKERANGAQIAIVCVDYTEPPAKEGLCDGADEDCDGETDEDFVWTEKQVAPNGDDIVLAKGAPCGVGACTGGQVVCDPKDSAKLWCDTLGNAIPEVEGGGPAKAYCDNVDNDCDGVVDGHTLPRDMTSCKRPGECAAFVGDISAQCVAGEWKCVYDFATYDGDAEKRCDGKDNDCDGQTDEDLSWSGLSIGQPCDGTGTCGAGVVECSSAPGQVTATCSTNPDGSDWVPAEEICDGKDNDCDGVPDDGLVWKDETGALRPLGESCDGVGECGEGKVICSVSAANAGETTCSTNVDGTSSGALIERCDGKDNDCDGKTDDDVTYQGSPLGGPCDGQGECGEGVVVCDFAAKEPTCSTDVNGTSSQAAAEVCDGKDNDCDAQTDEALTYADPVKGPTPLGAACEGVGECGAGTVVCSPTTTTATCSTNADGTAREDGAERCDAKDNDCDGAADDGVTWTNPVTQAKVGLGQPCQGVGKCAGFPGVVECSKLYADESTCSTMPDGSAPQHDAQERCNTIDDDCNGLVDDVQGATSPGVTCKLAGVCNTQNVVATCTAQGTWSCSYAGVANYEAVESKCDGLDNDCDGQTDEPETVVPLGACKNAGVCAGLLETCDGPLGFVCHYELLPDWTLSEENGAFCDAKDNDCDGKTDEKWPGLGGSCTAGLNAQCKETGLLVCGSNKDSVVCSVTGKPTSTACDDGNLCTKNDRCTGGDTSDCKGTAYTCAPDNLACTTDACVGDGTCSYTLLNNFCKIDGVCYGAGAESPQSDCLACTPATTTTAFTPKAFNTICNDGNDCNSNDRCNATGVCQGSGFACADDGKDCTVDKCTSLGNGDKLCDYATLKPSTCLIAGVCYSAGQPSDTNPCQYCNPAGSTTAWSNRANGTLCSDGNKCTLDDACSAGTCVGIQNPCDDGEVCTTDSCSSANLTFDGCAHTANSLACASDGAACTSDLCVGGTCTHQPTAGTCFISGVCRTSGETNEDAQCEACDPVQSQLAWSDKPNTATCDDGNPCTPTDKCNGTGNCVGSGLLSCDDDNPCTFDLCSSPTGCAHVPQPGIACTDDGLACTTDVCVATTCTHELKADRCLIGGTCYSTDALQPGNTCKSCQPATSTTAFSNRANGTTCDADGNGCTVGDSCQTGTCMAGAAADCSAQADVCNNPKCVSVTAATYNCGKQAKADGTACTTDNLSCTDDKCAAGVCGHPVVTGCLISGVCVAENALDPATDCRACRPTVNKNGYASLASGTTCVGDGLACTVSQCNGSGSCQNQPVQNGCIIGGACYATGATAAGNPCLVCDPVRSTSAWSNAAAGTACTTDNIACTNDVCDAAGSCQHQIQTDKCLVGGACYASGAADPTNECKTCDPVATRTAFTAKSVGSPCTDSDANPCTLNACDASAVCAVSNVTNGVVCDDANLCTAGDVCLNGVCGGTPGQVCDSGCQECDGSGGCAMKPAFCFIQSACVAAGASKSATEDCMQCVPGTSTSAWTGVSTGSCYDLDPVTPTAVTGVSRCRLGTCGAGVCTGAIGPVAETPAGGLCADNIDNDCDGLVDNRGATPDPSCAP